VVLLGGLTALRRPRYGSRDACAVMNSPGWSGVGMATEGSSGDSVSVHSKPSSAWPLSLRPKVSHNLPFVALRTKNAPSLRVEWWRAGGVHLISADCVPLNASPSFLAKGLSLLLWLTKTRAFRILRHGPTQQSVQDYLDPSALASVQEICAEYNPIGSFSI
jgi:hypothetical protein